MDNDEGLYNLTSDFIKQTIKMDVWDAAKELKEQLEEITYNKVCDIYKICDNWTQREWNEINFNEIVKSWREDYD